MRYSLTILATLILLSIAVSTSRAEVWFGGDLPYAFSNDDIDNGLGFQGKLQTPVKPFMLFEAALGWYKSDTIVDKLSDGDYSLTWLSGTLILTSTAPQIRPYGGIGLAYFMPSHGLSDRALQELDGYDVTLEEEINSRVGLTLKGGIAISLSPAAQIQLGITYLYFDTEVDYTLRLADPEFVATGSEKIDLSAFTIGFGIAFNPFAGAKRGGSI